MIQPTKTINSFQVDILKNLAATGITQFAEGGYARSYGDIAANEIGGVESREVLNLAATLLPYATGADLDYLGQVAGKTRLGQATASVQSAEQNLCFYVLSGTFGDINSGQPIQIPANTVHIYSPAGGAVYVANQITLNPGDSKTYFTANCATPGESGNSASKSLTQHDFTSYTQSIYRSLLVTNDYGVTGGRDDETDDNYRYRIQLKLQSQTSSNESALRELILEVAGVQDIAFSSQAGMFYVYVYGTVSIASSDLLAQVQQVIDDNVAFPLAGVAIAPDLVGISLNTTLHVSASLSSTERSNCVDLAATAARSYIDNLAIGEQLIINKISDELMNASPNILSVGDPNKPILGIYIWRSRTDGTRYSRSLVGDYTPVQGERVVVEVSQQLNTPVALTVVDQ